MLSSECSNHVLSQIEAHYGQVQTVLPRDPGANVGRDDVDQTCDQRKLGRKYLEVPAPFRCQELLDVQSESHPVLEILYLRFTFLLLPLGHPPPWVPCCSFV
jgi:hypothetical protein